MQHSNFFEDNGFFEFSSKPRYEQIKDFQFLKNEKDLQNSFSQYCEEIIRDLIETKFILKMTKYSMKRIF